MRGAVGLGMKIFDMAGHGHGAERRSPRLAAAILALTLSPAAAPIAFAQATFHLVQDSYNTQLRDPSTETDTTPFDQLQREAMPGVMRLIGRVIRDGGVGRGWSWAAGNMSGGFIVYQAKAEGGVWVRQYVADMERDNRRVRVTGFLCGDSAQSSDLADCADGLGPNRKSSRVLYSPRQEVSDWSSRLDRALYLWALTVKDAHYERGSVKNVVVDKRGSDGAITWLLGKANFDRNDERYFHAQVQGDRVVCIGLGSCEPIPADEQAAARQVAQRDDREAQQEHDDREARAQADAATVRERGPCIAYDGLGSAVVTDTYYSNGRVTSTPGPVRQLFHNQCSRTITVSITCSVFGLKDHSSVTVEPGGRFDTPAALCQVRGSAAERPHRKATR